MAAIGFTQRAEFESYVYNTEHTVDVLVTLRAVRSEVESSRAQMCLSAAIDRSGSMAGGKLDLVKRTLQFVVRQLNDADKIGLVTYESNVAEALPVTHMTPEGRQKGETAVQRIVSGGSTNLSGGLFQSIQQIKDSVEQDDHGNPGPVRAVLLLTDGLANQGITDPQRLQATLEAALRSGPPIKVHTFGYGNDHNGQLLKTIADIGQGNYYFIGKDDDVPTYFADALGGLATVVAQNAVLEVRAAQPGVTIEKVFTGMKQTTNEDGSHKIQSSDLYSEERKDIMVRLKIPALEAPVDADALLNVGLSYFDIPAAGSVNTEAIVCVKRPGEVPENQVADEDFIDQRLRIDVAEALHDAAQMAHGGNLFGAQQRLRGQALCMRGFARTDYNEQAQDELEDYVDAVSSTQKFKKRGNSLWQGSRTHATQRSAPMWRSTNQTATVQTALKATGFHPIPETTSFQFNPQAPAFQPPPATTSLQFTQQSLSFQLPPATHNSILTPQAAGFQAAPAPFGNKGPDEQPKSDEDDSKAIPEKE